MNIAQLNAVMKGQEVLTYKGETFKGHSVYHLNSQHTVTFISETTADAINYCAVKLVGEQDGKWLIAKRIANFMISESREIG